MQSVFAGTCSTSKYVPPTQQACVCINGNCTAEAYTTQSYYICDTYESDEFGPGGCISETKKIGSRFECSYSYNWGTIALCVLIAGGCTVACAGVTIGVGIPGCLACIAGYGLGCTGCSIITCTAAEEGTDIYADVFHSLTYDPPCNAA